jgi:Peptidase family M23
MSRHRTTAVAVLVLLAAWAVPATAGAAVPRLVFPVVAKVSYTNDFGAPRWQGRHMGNDIMAAKKSRVVAVEAGKVVKWTSSRAAGCMLYLYGASGTTYMYVHLNNDATMRNDNRGGCKNGVAYAYGLVSGQRVQAGQHIGYVGDSGDANGIASHLHFELHPGGGAAVSPYRRLRAAWRHFYHRPPASVTPLSLKVYGRVVATNTDTDPGRLAVKVDRVTFYTGWLVRPGRGIVVSVPADTTVLRQLAPGTNRTATFAGAKIGERVVVWTKPFKNGIWWARGPAGAMRTSQILLRGS